METLRSVELVQSLKDGTSEIYSLRWNEDDSLLASARGSGFIHIYSSDLELKQLLDCKIADNLPICSVRWRPDKGLTKNVLLAATSEGGVMHWHATTGKLIHTLFLEDNQALCCDYSPDADNFAVGCKDMSIKIVDDSVKEISSELKRTGDHIGHSNRVFSVKWMDENILFSAGWDQNIIMWDVRQGSLCKYFHGSDICGDSIDVMGDRLLCVDACISNQLKIWSISQGQIVFTDNLNVRGKPMKGYTAQFSKIDGGESFFVGGSGFSQGYFYNTRNLRNIGEISHLQHSIYTCDYGCATAKIAVGTSDGTLNIFRKIN